MSLKHLLTSLCILLIAASISADAPNIINYMGSLSDASGDPVADAGYSIKFTIYDASVAGTDLWNSGFQTVNTVDGIFSYQIGSIVVLPNGIFADTNRYLGITVGADAELTPRSRFNSVPYAHAIDESNFVKKTGDIMTGDLYVADGPGTIRAEMSGIFRGFRTFATDGTYRSRLFSINWGQLLLYDSNQEPNVNLGGGDSTGGYLHLIDRNGDNDMFLDAGGSGNSVVILPDSAIDNNEILDEPGIASNLSGTSNNLTGTMQDLVTVSITIPVSGYIKIDGKSWVNISGSTSGASGVLQIDETAGGSSQAPYYSYVGFESGYSNTGSHIWTVSASRVYFKTAGTYTFRLEGMRFLSAGIVNANNHIITAVFYPTSYGTVTTISPTPPTDADAEMVTSTNLDGSTSTGYKYDLRDLELKAKDAALKLKKAELELLKAQQQQANQD